MFESVITSKGQTTLPKGVRDAVSLRPGDRVRYALHLGGVWFMKVEPVSAAPFLKYDGPPLSLEDMERGVTEAMNREFRGPPEPQTYEDAMERLQDAEEEADAQRRRIRALEAENGDLQALLRLEQADGVRRASSPNRRKRSSPEASAAFAAQSAAGEGER